MLKVTRIGPSLAVVLDAESLNQYPLKEGDTVFLSQTPAGTTLIMAEASAISADPATVEQLRAGHEFMRDYHAALRALAK